jgi:RNA polymerase sigma factor (sigma-70 family)
MQISWDKLRNSDEKEWRNLFRQHAEFLYAYGMKFAHKEDLVKDIIQELFITIYEKRNSLNEPTSIRAYLCMALRNRLINELKKDVVVSLEDDDYSFTLYIDDDNADEEEKQYKKIQNLLNKLTNRQREVVYLKYFKGLSNEEIALTLGVNKQSVANLLSEAIRQMKKDASFILFLLLILRRILGL